MPVLVIEHEADASMGRFQPWLTAAGCTVDIRRPAAGDALPTDLTGYAGLVVLGGSPAAWEDEVAPWLPATRALIRLGVQDRVPTLGLCLGGQLMALALGGRVERGAAGWECGVVTVRPTAVAVGDPLVGHLPGDGLPAAQWHSDVVVELPVGARLLVAGSTYENQVFGVGDRAWGVQFHPEVTVADFCTWGALAPPSGVDVDAAYAQVRALDEALGAAWKPLADGFAGQVHDYSRSRL